MELGEGERRRLGSEPESEEDHVRKPRRPPGLFTGMFAGGLVFAGGGCNRDLAGLGLLDDRNGKSQDSVGEGSLHLIAIE